MYAIGVREDGNRQPYIRNNCQPEGKDRWYFPSNNTAYLRRLAVKLNELADDIDNKSITERVIT